MTGLSARLLVLTIFFVMLSEVFIYAPSIGRYRLVYMQERVAAAHLASLALQAPPDNAVTDQLLEELLDHARSFGIVLRRPASRALMLTRNMPRVVAATYDLRQAQFFPLIWEAFLVLSRDGPRAIRVIAPSPKDPEILVETIIDEAPMRLEMFDYSGRILILSILISLVTASLVFFSLQWLFVRPMLGITQSMVAFRANPEDPRRVISPGKRRDELGRAQRELADLQRGLRDALQQRARLAALGTAVTKINHDLRNILATAQLVSDRLGSSEDPQVRRIAPTLLGAIDRAVKLCTQTLRYAHEATPAPEFSRFDLVALVDEVGGEIVEAQDREVAMENTIAAPLMLDADRDQILRVFVNLLLNAYGAQADRVTISAVEDGDVVRITVADNGPGLPDHVRERLFQPFSASGRAGGTGLGLAIARDLMRGHGGEIELTETGESGSTFELRLPAGPEHRPAAASDTA